MNVRVSVLVLALMGLVAMIGGCAATPSHLSQPEPHGPECPAIQLASEVNFSGDRASALKKIAADPHLNEHEQEYLIDVATSGGGFSGDTADVLVVLARNPAMTANARAHMAEQLRDADLFSGDQQRVAEALAVAR